MFRFLLYPFNLLIDSLEGVGRYVELMASMFRSLFSWHKYLSLIVDQMFHIGVLSIPIVILTSLFSGMVTSVQAAYQFESGFVPNWFVGSIVGESVLMELAPMMTGLVMTGRIGATIAAEIRMLGPASRSSVSRCASKTWARGSRRWDPPYRPTRWSRPTRSSPCTGLR